MFLMFWLGRQHRRFLQCLRSLLTFLLTTYLPTILDSATFWKTLTLTWNYLIYKNISSRAKSRPEMGSSGPTFFEFVIKFLFWNIANKLAKNKPRCLFLRQKKRSKFIFQFKNFFHQKKSVSEFNLMRLDPPLDWVWGLTPWS